jgi:hypothetical protein
MNPKDAEKKDPTPEDEYNEEWDKLEKTTDDTKNKDTKTAAELEADEKEKADAKAKQDADDAKAKEEAGKSKDFGSVASMERALVDTKSAFNKATQEIATLKKKVEDLESGKATQADVDKAKQNVADAKANLEDIKTKVYKDYPELKDLLDPVLDRLNTLQRENEEAKKEREKEVKEREAKEAKEKEDGLLDTYNRDVLPEVLKEHKDFLTIIKDPKQEFFQWAEKQRPALKYAAMNSMDPDDIKWAVTEYKAFKAKPLAEEEKTAEELRKLEKQNLVKSMPGGAPPLNPKGKGTAKDPNDYDGGWDEAGKALEKQGIGAAR